MKKLIILLAFFIITMPFYSAYGQTIDTATWSLKAIGTDGTYRLLQNRSTYLGKAAGTVIVPIQFDVNGVDTSSWGFLPIGSDGTFRLVYNKETYLGKDSGTVVAQLIHSISVPSLTSIALVSDTLQLSDAPLQDSVYVWANNSGRAFVFTGLTLITTDTASCDAHLDLRIDAANDDLSMQLTAIYTYTDPAPDKVKRYVLKEDAAATEIILSGENLNIISWTENNSSTVYNYKFITIIEGYYLP